ncbi:MAG TPA: hypothetical protein VLJ16_10345, partial [Acidobacteriota bacterium]|nr:hypothetical protein [Acidobacteriota bacterium]
MGRRRFWTRSTLLAVSAVAVAAALVIGALAVTLPGLLSRDYDAKSLTSLRKQSGRIKEGFAAFLGSLEARKARYAAMDLPADASAFFPIFRASGLEPENEGIALSNGDGLIEAWYGNVLSLADQVRREDFPSLKRSAGSVLVISKATVYVVALQPLGDSGRILAHFARLAFIPQVRSTYIREFHALKPLLRTDFDIDYWDFREDVEGFEKFFARHRDEFTGQPRQKNEIQTLFFPLRNQAGRIVATVTLASPSLTSRLTVAREDLRLVLLLFLLVAGLSALAFVWSSPDFRRGRDALSGIVGAGLLVGVRLAALSFGSLERVQSLPPFKPAVAGFVSWKGLTQSPADIFLTALALLGLAVGLAVSVRGPRRGEAVRRPVLAAVLASAAAAGLAAAAVRGGAEAVRKVVLNSNLSLLRWDFDLSRLALQFALLMALAAVLLALGVVFRAAFRGAHQDRLSLPAAALGAAVAVLFGKDPSALFAGLVLAALWLSRSADDLTALRNHRLVETTVAHAVLTQETWGNFLIEESLPVLDRSEQQIVAYFKDPRDPDFAPGLWERTPVAKSNWYSSLELRDAEGNSLSRFSLNVPKVLGGPPELEPAGD